MTEQIASIGLDDPEVWLEQQLEGMLAEVAKTDLDRRVWLATIASAKLGLLQLAKQPLVVDIAWPSGMNKLQRQTMTAQLQHELRRAAIRRLAEEWRVLLTLAPGIASGLVDLAQQLPDDELPAVPPKAAVGLLERIRRALGG